VSLIIVVYIYRKKISLDDARTLINEKEITQEEIAVLARLKARENGLHRARKLSRSNVSMFLHGKLPESHTFTAIHLAIQDYLKIDIDINLNDSHNK